MRNMLHIINKSPFYTKTVDTVLKFSKKGSPILLIEDATAAAAAGSALCEAKLGNIMRDHPIYVLKEDLEAKGVHKVIEGIKVIDYAGFVELVEKYNTCSWA